MDTVGGFTIAPETDAFGGRLRRHGWTLTDPVGDYLLIGGHGHIAPTYRAALAERDHRLAWEAEASRSWSGIA